MKSMKKNWLMRLIGMSTEEAVQNRAVRDVAGSLLLNITGRILQIGLAILLARILPLKEFGLFALVMSWVMVLVVPSMLGTRQFVQREIAVAKAKGQWPQVKALLRWSTVTVLLVSFMISAFAVCWLIFRIPVHHSDNLTFIVGFALLPLLALLRLWQAQLRGWGAILAGQIPENIVQRLSFGALLLAGAALLASVKMGALTALLMQGLAISFALAVTAFFKFRYLRIPSGGSPEFEVWKWIRLSSRFTLLGGLVTLNSQVGVLIVGVMMGKAATGLFSVAVKGADLLTVAFLAATTALAPRMAAFYSENRHGKLQLMLVRAYRVVALLTFPVFLLFVFAGSFFLKVFGSSFEAALSALIILSFGKFFSVLSGPNGMMLNMAGQERVTAMAVAVSVVLTVAASVVLIPLMGINGAALASTLGIVTWNVLLVIFCYKRLGIWTPVLGISLVRKKRSVS